jgi:hypothetical protein
MCGPETETTRKQPSVARIVHPRASAEANLVSVVSVAHIRARCAGDRALRGASRPRSGYLVIVIGAESTVVVVVPG